VKNGDRGDDESRFEKKKMTFHNRIREGFLQIAKNEPRRVKVIDGTLSSDRVFKEIKKILKLKQVI